MIFNLDLDALRGLNGASCPKVIEKPHFFMARRQHIKHDNLYFPRTNSCFFSLLPYRIQHAIVEALLGISHHKSKRLEGAILIALDLHSLISGCLILQHLIVFHSSYKFFHYNFLFKKINDHTFKFQSQHLLTVSADGMKTEIHVLAITSWY
jgi:hypothetical protein